MKACTKCGESKPLEAFAAARTGRDGRRGDCKACRSAYNRERRQADPEGHRARSASYYAQNRASVIAHQQAYQAAKPEVRWTASYRQRTRRYGHLPIVEEFTHSDVVALHGDACAHCGGDFEELDHFPIPVSQGGPHTLDNVRPSCAPCNQQSWRGALSA